MSNFLYFSFVTGSLTSVPFLIVVVILYLGVKELRTTHGKVLASYSACLAFAYFSLSMVQLFGDQMIYELCVSMGKHFYYTHVYYTLISAGFKKKKNIHTRSILNFPIYGNKI